MQGSERVLCKHCNEFKSLSDFTASNVSKRPGEDGLRYGRCRACHAKYNAEYVKNMPRVLEPTVRYKTCASCTEHKAAAEFRMNPMSKDGLSHKCLQCWHEHEAKQQLQKVPVAVPQVAEKECVRCHVVKAAKDFSPHIRAKDGLNSACRSCASEYNRARAAALKEQRQQGALSEHVAFKVCQRCHLGQSASAFSKDASRSDGLHTWCKACRSKSHAETKAAKKQLMAQLGPLVIQKTCRACGEEKTAAEFVQSAAAADGLYHSCKACHRALARARTLAKAKALEGSEGAPVTVTSKRCPGCGEIKPAECFGRLSRVYSASGLAIYCKPCKIQRDKQSKERRLARQQQAAAGAAAAAAPQAGRAGSKRAAAGLGAGSRKRQRETSSSKDSSVPAVEAAAAPSASKRRKQQQHANTESAAPAGDSRDDKMEPEQPHAAAVAAAAAEARVGAVPPGHAGAGSGRGSGRSRFVITSDDLEDDQEQNEDPAAAAAAAAGRVGLSRAHQSTHIGTTTTSSSSSSGDDSGGDEDANMGRDSISSSESESEDLSESDGQKSESVSESDDSDDADWSDEEGLAARAVSRATAKPPVLRQQQQKRQQQDHHQQQPLQQSLQQQQQQAAVGIVGCGVPMLLPGQLQVLGQTMTPAVAAAFRSAVALHNRRLSVKLLTDVGSRQLQRIMQDQLKQYLCKHIPLQEGAAAVTSWPSSLPMHPDVEAYMLPPKQRSTHIAPSGRPLTSCPLLPGAADDSMPDAGSSRNSSSSNNGSLAAQRGMRVKQQGALSRPAVAAGSVIGPFAGLQGFAHEMPGIAAKPWPGWQGSALQWQLQFDAFSLDLADFNVPAEVCSEEAEIAEAADRPLALAVCALLHGNETALINDARPDPLSQPVLDPTGPQPNVMVVEVEVGGWVFPFAVATADVGPGQELLLDYGQEYWEGRRLELQAAAQRGPRVKRLRRRPDGTLLPGQLDHMWMGRMKESQ